VFKTLRSRVIISYFIVVIISLVLASIFFTIFLSRYIRDRERDDLKKQVGAVARDVARVNEVLPLLVPSGQPGTSARIINGILDTESDVLTAKLFVVTPDGNVVAEALRRPLLGRRRLNLPPDLLSKGGTRITERFFERFGKDYLFAAAPTTLGAGESGYLLAIKPAEEVGGATATMIWYVVLAGVGALVISMLIALYLSWAISRPVRAVTAAARKMAAGDYAQQVEVKGPAETAELARDFNLMAERVRTAYEKQLNFAANVSHELRTPLTSIEGFSQALLEGVSRSDEERRRSLEIINKESKRLGRVTRDILLLSQIDAGEVRYEPKPVDIVDLLGKVKSVYEPQAEDGGIDLRIVAPPEPLTASTDSDRLERILANLLDNAMKYTGRGGTVTITASRQHGALEVSVNDTGPGIDPSLLPKIFDRFYRVDANAGSRKGGAGLGLAICSELVQSLGGSITVQSSPGAGTTFTVRLPL
jgi:signal transduction histidine kinase